MMIDPQLVTEFQERGFVVVPGLFAPDEVEAIKTHFMQLNAQKMGAFEGDTLVRDDADPLKKYPRMVHPHRWDEVSLRWMLDDRLRQWTTALLGMEPYAAQTMFYFKPAGARGQALHQDQRSLEVQPGTCLAAWMAVDPCDEENGCMQVIPNTQDLPKLCLVDADTRTSFTGSTVPLADWMKPEPVIMQPGDVLFFNGQVIHGSGPNTSQNRFRRSLIAHYVVGEAEKVAKFYHPVLNFDGQEVDLQASEHGGPCGVWVDTDGQPVLEFVENGDKLGGVQYD
jgi:ectoine hydroxylase-related dioxygenase (phytanoyl-CoA dioxygenase family)